MAWLFLLVAGLFEVVWAVMLKQSEGFTKLWPSVITIAAMWVSFGCLAMALKTLPIGNAYAIWTGIGAVGVAIVGIVWFNESIDFVRVACIGLIVAGVVGLKVLGSGNALV
ncbi:quaternary ammonium compound-resistance protein SugE [Veronia nyctiphanis]|uniref:Guanidinium exporter n=1 Tax=Veronia nyctiphanis TaxID=1278244 RepID=A0A4Q0YV48_9GAMM|nr:quaternary ammonium compound efflux SMR transporter SugE [Veronia nyctiphanis]RXJ72841.1 quaternary ammonium compound-resistance protein SugE [Veronia nyctiphanis]